MSSGTFDASPSDDRGGPAFGPGRRWALAVIVVLALAAGAVISFSGGGAKPVGASAGYGQLPKWLPKTRTPAAPQYEQATANRPILAEEQGYTVHATLPSGSVDVTAVGPGFPSYVTNDVQRGLWPEGKPVPSLFYVTLSNVKGTIPLSRTAFSVENSAFQHARATASQKGGGSLPTSVKAGQTVTLVVRSRTLEGQGAIAWTPVGSKALVAWIFQVELD